MEEKIVEKVSQDIKALKSGQIFTFREFMEKYGIKDEEMFAYFRLIYQNVKDFVGEKDAGGYVGLPYNLEYYKK